ncbi:undecaprenyl-phosphate glucose phosphotransferase [candidate division KSB1 bacterium]|nr:undecaprenyl-phosphate glucose phosphotransferase [candidate division KSB1 bacterium]
MFSRRKGDVLIPLLAIIFDVLAIELAFLTSYWIRFYSPFTDIFPVTKGYPPLGGYIYFSMLVIFAWLPILYFFKLYRLRWTIGLLDELYLVAKAVSTGMLVAMSLGFLYRGFSYSRLVFAILWVVSIVFVTVERAAVIRLRKRLYRSGVGTLNTAIVGSSQGGESLYQRIKDHPDLGYRVLGFVGVTSNPERKELFLGTLDRLDEIIKEKGLDLLFIALTYQEHPSLMTILKKCEGVNIEFLVVPDMLELLTSQPEVTEISGIHLLTIKKVPISGWNAVLKRCFDVVLSAVSLVVLSPFFLVFSALIKLDSAGPVFYRQLRIGFDGKEFWMLKFRSMKQDAESSTGPIWASQNDQRVTKVGKFLRRLSLDEIPQLINVLNGEMSLVGPRPERPFFVKKFSNQVSKYLERHRVKSGMTGWAQVNGWRGNTSIEERTKFDVFYVENWSLVFDIKIILKTFWEIFTGKNAY